MNHTYPIVVSLSDRNVVPERPVREQDAELTPRAEANAANKLPKAEQLAKFEQDLEAHDSGNQPA